MPRLIRISKYEAERWRQGPKFRLHNECQVDLKGTGEKKYAISPRAGNHVEMMQGAMLIVHVLCPLSEDVREIRCNADTKGEIYVRPFIFA